MFVHAFERRKGEGVAGRLFTKNVPKRFIVWEDWVLIVLEWAVPG
jgi:hypothetical protein